MWQQYASYGTISLTQARFYVGQASVEVRGTAYYLLAKFKITNSFNGVAYPDGKLSFWISCTGAMATTGTISLEDIYGVPASVNISVNNAGVWEYKELPFSSFTALPTFDWTKITWVDFKIDKNNALEGAFYVDDFHFTFEAPDSILLLQSLPSGKSGVLNTSYIPELFGMPANFVTPSSITLPKGLPLTVQMDATNFDHWADDANNTNPTRTLNIPTTDLTLQAVYATQANPLLVIDSFDPNMDVYSAVAAVRIVRAGIPQIVNVPFAGRVLKDSYTLTALDATKFDYWKLPDGNTDVNLTITVDVQSDVRVEAHWKSTSNGGNGFNWLILVGGGLLVAGAAMYFLRRR